MFPLYYLTALGLAALTSSVCIHDPIVLENDVTPDEIQLILNKHNFVRDLVAKGLLAGQPKAINLNPLEWDDRLAEGAQTLTSYGGTNYTVPPYEDDRFDWVGQSVIWWGSNGYDTARSDWDGVLNSWFDRNQNFIYPNITIDNADFYLQIVAADTKYIGCGYTSYFGSDVLYNKKYACYYGPGGPNSGEPPYETE